MSVIFALRKLDCNVFAYPLFTQASKKDVFVLFQSTLVVNTKYLLSKKRIKPRNQFNQTSIKPKQTSLFETGS